MNYDYQKKREAMISKIMHELNLELEEATLIYHENLRSWGKKGGLNNDNRHKFTTETAREARKKRKDLT